MGKSNSREVASIHKDDPSSGFCTGWVVWQFGYVYLFLPPGSYWHAPQRSSNAKGNQEKTAQMPGSCGREPRRPGLGVLENVPPRLLVPSACAIGEKAT
jgi:hypothetical protein